MHSRDSRWERDEDLRRTGMDPDPWGRDQDAMPPTLVRLFWRRYAEAFVADGNSWGEAADEEDGDA